LVGAAVVPTSVSISAFEILMGASVVALVFTRRRPRLPPVWIPLILFMAGTLISLVASGHFREGLPQIRKFLVYAMLFLVTTAFQTVFQIRALVVGWVSAAAISAAWSLRQFYQKYSAARAAGRAFYTY
jgi:hypothetical protein